MFGDDGISGGGGYGGGGEELRSAVEESMKCDSGQNPETGIWRRDGDGEGKRWATSIGQGYARGFPRVWSSSGNRSTGGGTRNWDRLHE